MIKLTKDKHNNMNIDRDLEIIRGDSKQYELRFKNSAGVPINITGATVYFTVKKSYDLDDTNATTGIIAVSIRQFANDRTFAWPTASRQPANKFYVGYQAFDTTLNIPIWSDGTNWRNASGVIV